MAQAPIRSRLHRDEPRSSPRHDTSEMGCERVLVGFIPACLARSGRADHTASVVIKGLRDPPHSGARRPLKGPGIVTNPWRHRGRAQCQDGPDHSWQSHVDTTRVRSSPFPAGDG